MAMTLQEVRARIREAARPYYCYILLRPTGEPFYIGIGKRKRVFDHELGASRNQLGRRFSIIRKIRSSGGVIGYSLSFYETRIHAVNEECRLIALYGRLDLKTGTLTNLTDGGEGGGRGPETRAKLSAALKGRKFSEDWLRKMSAAKAGWKPSDDVLAAGAKWRSENASDVASSRKKIWTDPNYREKMSKALTGVKRSADYSAGNRDRQIAKFQDPEFRARWAAAQAEGLGRPETREKLRQTSLANWADPAFRERMMAARKRSRSE